MANSTGAASFPSVAGVMQLPGWRVQRTIGTPLEDCSLLVPTYRRTQECLTMLNAMLKLDDVPAEVVFIDGARDEGFNSALWQWANQHRLPFDILYAQSPPGLTRQRNVAVDLSSGKYLFFLDDDAIPLPGFFREIQKVFHADTKGDLGSVAACIINEMECQPDRRWELRFRSGLVPRVEPMHYMSCGIHTPRSLMRRFTGTREVNVFFGGGTALKRDVFDTMRFSEFFQGYSYGEDTEMALRVSSQWRILCCGDAHMTHHPAPGGRPPGFQRGKMEVINRVFIWKRHIKHPSFTDRARFWLDVCFQVGMDFAWFGLRPKQTEFAAHGFGLMAAMMKCLVAPPKYEEPPVRRYYELVPGAVPAAQASETIAEAHMEAKA